MSYMNPSESSASVYGKSMNNLPQIVETPYQVRILFAQSGVIGKFSFANFNEAFMAFNTALQAWDTYSKVALQTVNGIYVIETDEVAMIGLV